MIDGKHSSAWLALGLRLASAWLAPGWHQLVNVMLTCERLEALADDGRGDHGRGDEQDYKARHRAGDGHCLWAAMKGEQLSDI